MSSLFEHPAYPTVHYVLIISLVLALSFYVARLTTEYNPRVSGFAVVEKEPNNASTDSSERLYSARSYYFYLFFILLLSGIIIALFILALFPFMKRYT